MKKFYIKTLGCKVNQYDSAKLKNILISYGFSYNIENPDYIIINTCAVTKVAIKKDWQIWQNLKNKFPLAKIILIGCWPKIYKSEKFKKADLVIADKDLKKIAQKISQINKNKNKKEKENILKVDDKSRYFLKIADGCNQFCSYCIIPFSRGRLSSVKKEEIIAEAKAALDYGYNEIVLTAIHLGAYGKDFKSSSKYTLFHLLKDLLKETKNVRYRLSSIEVNEVNSQLIDLIANSKGRICQNLHIPLQSGSDKILKLMKRPYNTNFFQKKIDNIKSKIPKVAINTDLIVGFPGENNEDFIKTYNLAKELAFSKIHVFPFSEHELAAASKFKNQVKAQEKKERSKLLRDLSDQLANHFKAKILSALKSLTVLIEKKEGSIYIARSEFYFLIKFKFKNKKTTNILVGKLLNVKLKEIEIII